MSGNRQRWERLRLPRYQLRPGRNVEVRRAGAADWQPHTTRNSLSFQGYESIDLGRYVFRRDGWLVRCWPDDFIDYRPELRLDRWKLQPSVEM